MDSEKEQLRFKETNRIIKEELSNVENLLEIGCGEGHQSKFLNQVCQNLYGFDVSKTAIDRAQTRCPDGNLFVADIDSYQLDRAKFDLVVACEILYYVKDIPRVLKKMNELGRNCMVTFYQSGTCDLDKYFDGNKYIKSKVIQSGQVSWKVVWWDNTEIEGLFLS